MKSSKNIQTVLALLFFAVVSTLMFLKPLLETGSHFFEIAGDLIVPIGLDNLVLSFYPLWNSQMSQNTFVMLNRLPLFIPLLTFAKLFKLHPMTFMELIWVLSSFIAGVSMYFTASFFLKKTYKANQSYAVFVASMVAGFFYMFNPYVIYRSHHTNMRLVYAFVPLLLLLFLRSLDEGKGKYLVGASLVWAVVTSDPHWLAFGFLLLLSCFFYLSSYDFYVKRDLKSFVKHFWRFSVITVSYVMLSLYWLLPSLSYSLQKKAAVGPSYVLSPGVVRMLSTQTSLINTVGFRTYWLWNQSYGAFSQVFQKISTESLTLVFGVIIFSLSVFALMLKPKNKEVIFFSFSLFFWGIFQTGANVYSFPGVRNAYLWIVFKAPFHHLYGFLFRESSKLIVFPILFSALLLSFAIVELVNRIKDRNFTKLSVYLLSSLIISFIVISISLLSWPLLTGDFNGELKPVEIPSQYYQVNKWLEKRKGDFRVIWMPKYDTRAASWNPKRWTGRFDDFSSFKPTYSESVKTYYGYLLYIYFKSLNVIQDKKTNTLGKFLSFLNIKYLIFHNDVPSLKNRSREALGFLKAQKDLVLKKSLDFMYVFENKQSASGVFNSLENILVFGDLNTMAALNSLKTFDPSKTSVVFTEQSLPLTRNFSKVNYGESMIFKGKSSKDLLLSLASKKYVISLFDKAIYLHSLKGLSKFNINFAGQKVLHRYSSKGWSRAKTDDSLHAEWHPYLEEQDIENWDFDYGEGVVFTSAPASLVVPLKVDKSGGYELFVRFFRNRKGGRIRLDFDKKLIKEINTKSQIDGFVWRKAGEVSLGQGGHELTLENIGGFNAVNVLALIPKKKVQSYREKARKLLKSKRIVHVFEAETDLYYENAVRSRRFGAEASNGKVLKLSSNSSVWKDIEIARPGRYRLAVRGAGPLKVKLDDKELAITSEELKFSYSESVFLNKGRHRLEITGNSLTHSYLDAVWLYSVKEKAEKLDDIFANTKQPAKILSYSRINSTKYEVKIRAAEPFMLAFAEAYDPGWTVKISDISEVKSIPLYSVINGFYIPKKGNLTITVEYLPQRWFYVGSAISLAALLILVGYLIVGRREQGIKRMTL
jgi:hypothetical protein